MLKVEYLLTPDKTVKCIDPLTLNHLFQSNPKIKIHKDSMTVGSYTAGFKAESGNINNKDEIYFHITLSCSDPKDIDRFETLIREANSIIYLINNRPSILYDDVSLHYSRLAYPQIFEVENLMRKLITKFMLINVGVDWSKDHVPDDVERSVQSNTKETTYLHNIDFIQLKNFLFSENFPNHKNKLIEKLKTIKQIEELNMAEVRLLIPQSNWEKFFSDSLNITQEELNKKWDKLYELRCKIAHNKTFTKNDYETVLSLSTKTKTILATAIEKLSKIEISQEEVEVITETVASSFDKTNGSYIAYWKEMDNLIKDSFNKVLLSKGKDIKIGATSKAACKLLENYGFINTIELNMILYLITIRNRIVHDSCPEQEVEAALSRLKETIPVWEQKLSNLKQL